MLPPRCGRLPGLPVPFGPGGRGRGRRPAATSAGDEAASGSKPRWSDALETAQAKAGEAAQAAQAAAKRAAEHPLGSKSLELWQQLPQGARDVAPGVAGGAVVLAVAAVARGSGSRNPRLAEVRVVLGRRSRGMLCPVLRPPDTCACLRLPCRPAWLFSCCHWPQALAVGPRLNDVAYLQSALLSALDDNKALTKRCLEAELALKAATEAAARSAASAKKR